MEEPRVEYVEYVEPAEDYQVRPAGSRTFWNNLGNSSRNITMLAVFMRIGCIILAVIAIILIYVGYYGAKWFSSEEKEVLVCPYDETGTFVPNKDTCELQNLTRCDNCDNRNNRLESANEEKRPCPSKWLVIIPWFLIIACTVAAIILLLLLFCCRCKDCNFVLIDLICSSIIGVIMVGSGICLLCYYFIVQQYNACSEKNVRMEYDLSNQEDRELDYWRRFGPDASTESSKQNKTSTPAKHHGGAHASRTAKFDEYEAQCSTFEKELYMKEYFLWAGILAIIAGVLCILIALCVRRNSRVRPGE